MPARKFHHATIREAADFEPGSFRTLKFPETGGVPARVIIGRVRGETKTTTQALLFPAYWTRRRVEEWIDQAGRRALRIAWANPEGDGDRLRAALERIKRYAAEALADLRDGNARGAEFGIRAAAAAANSAALAASRVLRENPSEERYTTAQTHIREALAHLIQADRDSGKGETSSALEALEAAHEHIDQAQDRLTEAEVATANPCRPARNPTAQGTKPTHWNPSPTDNPYKPDRWALDAYRRKARAAGLHGVTWKHPTAGYIFTHSPHREPFATFKERESERIRKLGGKVGAWYPVRGSSGASSPKKNPPPPRQLVRLGDVLEVHLASGKGYRWKKGEAAMLVSPGLEKDSRGRGRLVLSPLRGARPAGGKGPHKTSERTYETWHGKLPKAKKSQIADVPGPDEFGKTIGQVKAIVYSSTKWQTKPASYIHEFEAPLPTLYAGPVGTFEIRGGGFRVTARGIVG
jgi:hypothetical protein